jgi:hypothetical protein
MWHYLTSVQYGVQGCGLGSGPSSDACTQSTSRSVTREGTSRQHTSVSYVERTEPVFSPTELDALPAEAVIVQVQGPNQQYRVLGERLNPIPTFATLPPPPPVVRPARIRSTMAARPAQQGTSVGAAVGAKVAARMQAAASVNQHMEPHQDGSVAPTPLSSRDDEERYW